MVDVRDEYGDWLEFHVGRINVFEDRFHQTFNDTVNEVVNWSRHLQRNIRDRYSPKLG
ncbi:unnamed protein product, partial [Nesidiocoris tenuis]